MKKILVTGANGQLGQCLQKISSQFEEFEFIFTDSEILDITNKEEVNDLSDAERAQLKEIFAGEFDPADDSLENKIEKSINAAVAVLDLIDAFKKDS
jgi:dTDP-4-dehydrorhamnose reductase